MSECGVHDGVSWTVQVEDARQRTSSNDAESAPSRLVSHDSHLLDHDESCITSSHTLLDHADKYYNCLVGYYNGIYI